MRAETEEREDTIRTSSSLLHSMLVAVRRRWRFVVGVLGRAEEEPVGKADRCVRTSESETVRLK